MCPHCFASFGLMAAKVGTPAAAALAVAVGFRRAKKKNVLKAKKAKS